MQSGFQMWSSELEGKAKLMKEQGFSAGTYQNCRKRKQSICNDAFIVTSNTQICLDNAHWPIQRKKNLISSQIDCEFVLNPSSSIILFFFLFLSLPDRQSFLHHWMHFRRYWFVQMKRTSNNRIWICQAFFHWSRIVANLRWPQPPSTTPP